MVDDRDDGTDTIRRHDEPAASDRSAELANAPTGLAPAITPTPLPPPPNAGWLTSDSEQGTLPARPGAKPRPETRLPLGDLDTRYELRERLGEGGMGEVLLARDRTIGREVAIKRIRAAEPSAEELARFEREARVQGRLEHPAVVPVHDLAVDRHGRPFFVMKRLSGVTMLELLTKLRAGDHDDEDAVRRRLLRAYADVCLAIEFAHQRGIVHRDLKPANIMLGDFGEVYVLDWGVARALAEDTDVPSLRPTHRGLELETGDTQAGTVLGTPAYMAPEQLAGDRAGPAADIYALGCILYEIAAGEPLHAQRRTPGEAVAAVPSNKRAESPPELDAICERATQHGPAARYRSARALGDAVQAFLDGDRDIAMREELARTHIAEARAALARGETEADRRDAMRAAGRALALDPTAADAADLVTHLMLKPPSQVPAEVRHKIAAIDTETARVQGRYAALSMFGYLCFVPLLLWTGVRDSAFLVAFALLAAGSGVQVLLLTRGAAISRAKGGIYLNACINAVLIGLIARMVGPFIIAPTLVLTTLMAYAAHPQFGDMRIMAVILGSSVVIPWGLELLGVLAPTYRFTGGGELVMSSPVLTFTSAPVQIAFALLLVALIAVVGVLSRMMALRQREATRQLEIQAWHLRQVVPTSSG